MKILLSALAALMLIGVATTTPAQAACWWNGYNWVCGNYYWYRGHPYYRHYYHRGWHGYHHYRHYR